jgi:hypothetical protein
VGVDLALKTEIKAAPTAHSWLRSAHGTSACESITLDGDLFANDMTNWANGVVPAGTVLAVVEASDPVLYGPYDNNEQNADASEVQTLTLDAGADGGTFTLTVPETSEEGWDGLDGTTSALAWNISTADMTTALEGIVGAGNVVVTKPASAYVITFGGDLANTNAPLLTIDDTLLTDGGLHVDGVIAVQTAGGDGRGVAKGFLFQAVDLGTTAEGATVGNITAALLWHGSINEAGIPQTTGPGGLDSNAKTDLAKLFRFTTV